jgi:hypothetical protein
MRKKKNTCPAIILDILTHKTKQHLIHSSKEMMQKVKIISTSIRIQLYKIRKISKMVFKGTMW